ncbi:hypothetical protein [Streptomyces sp. NPDC003015]
MHITLAYLSGLEVGQLAEAAALTSADTWPAVPVELTGETGHGSWELQKNPNCRHDPATVQAAEQIRLGIRPGRELDFLRKRPGRRSGRR